MHDVWERLPQLLVAATSVYGTVFKIDSTKKICKKLEGAAAGTASWATNVGNKRGEVVISVLTKSEDNEALRQMACGLRTIREGSSGSSKTPLHGQRLQLYKRPLQVPGQ